MKNNLVLTGVTFCGIALAAYLAVLAPAYIAYVGYRPISGDVIFQSHSRNKLVDAIEGVTESRISHCGIVGREDSQWVVYEAIGSGVQVTPLGTYLFRGRAGGYSVYRLKPEHQVHVPETLRYTQTYLGKPYDIRYRMDDEKIYCSELIYKAYQQASGDALGQLDRFGDLNWQPHESAITYFEGGPVPLDREMITPIGLSKANQLEKVYSFNFE